MPSINPCDDCQIGILAVNRCNRLRYLGETLLQGDVMKRCLHIGHCPEVFVADSYTRNCIIYCYKRDYPAPGLVLEAVLSINSILNYVSSAG